MPRDAADLAHRLSLQAEAVCRHYLSNGRRDGRYWLVGDARNTPGRSLFVRLRASTHSAAGKWTDAATGEHGDLLDIIRESCGLGTFKQVTGEARRFLSLPCLEQKNKPVHPVPSKSHTAARRLSAMALPITGTLVETYLRGRGMTALHEIAALRFHPRCYYRPGSQSLPAMIAAVTDLAGRQTGAHRTWLSRDGSSKAPVETPRRAMGDLLGHGVRFGVAREAMAAGEGIETVLSARMGLPQMPMLAALSAVHLAAILFPAGLRRLYVVRDRDRAGDGARDRLAARAAQAGIEAVILSPMLGDFNDDLRTYGVDALRVALRDQLHPEDVPRFLKQSA